MLTGNTNWYVPVQRDFLRLNLFKVKPGRERVTHIASASSYLTPDRTPITLLLYSDPNQDGDPSDAVLLASATTTHVFTGAAPEYFFARVQIEPTFIGPAGTKFFVGAVSYGGGAVANSSSGSEVLAGWAGAGPPHQPGGIDIENPSKAELLVDYLQWMMEAVTLDCNQNGVWDQCDIDQGVLHDLNGNGFPDECEPLTVSCRSADIAPSYPIGDNVVGVADLLAIISRWGPCPSPAMPCFADIAPPMGDGVIGVPDLLAVIANWGPCR